MSIGDGGLVFIIVVGWYVAVKNLIRGIREGIVNRRIVKYRPYTEEPLEGDDARQEGIFIVIYSFFFFGVMALFTAVLFLAPE